MRKVFLENLPKKHGVGVNKDKLVIDWKNAIGKTVRFTYDDIDGEINIIDYDKDRKLHLNYLNKTDFKMHTGHFTECKLKELLGLKTIEYKYNIDDIIENKTGRIKIIKQIRIESNSSSKENRTDKGYEYECLECGNKDTVSESHIKIGRGCNVCCLTPRKIIKGINDIATVAPYLVKYFLNKEDAFTNSIGSNAYVNVVCDQCQNTKVIMVNDLYSNGIACPKCGDGYSYPNKFIFNILEQLNINFETEKSFKWSQNKRYDFYTESFKNIIEAHGSQHYLQSYKQRLLEEEQENDRLKEQLAKDNGIQNYIIIDCRKSELEFIKNNIINSKLAELFDLSNIDWLKCHEYACSSIIKEACDLWNSGIKSTVEIGKLLKRNHAIIGKYLKKGVELDWCDYKTRTTIKNNNILECSKLWNNGTKNTHEIADILNLDRQLVTIYLKEASMLGLCDYNPRQTMIENNIKNSKLKCKPIICLENNMCFESSNSLERMSLDIFNIKISSRNASKVCRGILESYKGYHFKYVS